MSDDDPPPAGQRVSPKDFAPFALAALIGLASIVLPGPGLDWTLFAVATGLTVLIAIAGFAAAVTGRAPIMMLLGPLAYLCVVALLRHASPTGGGGFVPLIILPVVFLALFGTRRQLLIGLVAMAAVLLVPALVYGEPRYAASAWRSTVLWLTVAALTGLSIQTLVARVREGLAFSNAVVDTAGSLVMVLDPQGRIERFNQACERLPAAPRPRCPASCRTRSSPRATWSASSRCSRTRGSTTTRSRSRSSGSRPTGRGA